MSIVQNNKRGLQYRQKMQFIWKEQEEMEYTKLGQTGKEKAHTIQMRQVWEGIF